MKEAIGGAGILIFAILFILLFGSFLSASVNYSKAFKVKNEIVNIIEREKGVNDATLEKIYDYMTEVGYRTTGNCDDGNWKGYNTNSKGDTYRNPMICIDTVNVNGNSVDAVPTAYYKVRVFYNMDIPIFQSAFHFRIEGTTKKIIFPKA